MSSHRSISSNTSATNSSFGSTKESILLLSTTNGRKLYRVKGSNFDLPERYSITDSLGHGSYGVVVAAVDEHTDEEIAIKRVGRVFDDLVDGRRILREVSVLRVLNHYKCRNVLRLHGLLQPKETIAAFRDIYMVMEVCETDLYYISRRIKPFSLTAFKSLTVAVLHAMADMHAIGIIHRDMKPSNILLNDDESEVRICDFGLARGGMHIFKEGDGQLTDYVVTRWYRAPELLLMSHYHLPVDIWSVGCVLLEYIIHIPLFAGKDYLDQLRLVVQTVDVDLDDLDFLVNRNCVPFLKDFVAQYKGKKPLSNILPSSWNYGDQMIPFLEEMLNFNPHRRATANELLQHPFFGPEDGAVPSTLSPSDDVDWRFDHTVEFTEPQLRRKMWNEIKQSAISDT